MSASGSRHLPDRGPSAPKALKTGAERRNRPLLFMFANGGFVPSAEKIAPRRGKGLIDSDLSILSKGKRVLHVNPEIAHRILDFAVTE